MAGQGLMTAKEFKQRQIICAADRLSLSIEKWERAGTLRSWPLLKSSGGAYRYLMADTCALCSRHKIYFGDGIRLGEHCLGYSGQSICPLAEKNEMYLIGCNTTESPWHVAYEAAKRGDRPAFMKARAKILRRLRAARKWY